LVRRERFCSLGGYPARALAHTTVSLVTVTPANLRTQFAQSMCSTNLTFSRIDMLTIVGRSRSVTKVTIAHADLQTQFAPGMCSTTYNLLGVLTC